MPVSSERLVGRREELDRFDAALERCMEGAASALVLGGEAGVGKTRLTEEFVRRAVERGATALRGRCLELTEASLPYAPFVEALRRLVRELDPAARESLLAPGRRELRHLLPELAGGDEDPDTASTTSQARLFEILLGLFRRLSERAPLVAVIEDLHWSDRSTRDLLAFTLRNVGDERMLAICTYRSDDLHRGHPLRAFLAELDRSRRIDRLEMQPLTRTELEQQLESLLGGQPEPSLVDSVFARSDGNPFFVEELVAAGAGVELPPTLREILLARVDQLSPAAQDVLHIASVAGRQVPDSLLAAVSPLPAAERVAGLREAVARHILVLDANDGYAFRHALQREAVYGQLLPAERTALHAEYARALEAGAEGASAGETAYHWHAAHDLPRALRTSVEAGRAAERGYGFVEAQRFYELALEIWSQVPDAAERAGIDHATLLRRTAEAANLAGDHGRAAAFARTAIAGATALAPGEVGVLYERLGRFLWASGDSEAALEAYEEAVRLVPPAPPSAARARALAARGQALMLLARYGESHESCEEAIEMARAVGSRSEEGHALNTLGCDVASLGDPETGVGRLREALVIAEEVGDLDDLARAYLNLSDLLTGQLGRPEEGLALATEGVALARRVGLASDYGVSLQSNAVNALYALGRWDEALAVLDEAELARPIEMAAIDLHQSRTKLLVARGEVAAARDRLAATRRLMVKTIDPQVNAPFCAHAAELALWEGSDAEAQEHVAEGMNHLAGTDDAWLMGPLAWLGTWAAVNIALAGRVRRGTAAEPDANRFARELRAVVARREKRGRFVPPTTLAYAALCEAELARLRDGGTAEPWREAHARIDQLSHPYLLAYARWREAEALLAGRRTKEADAPLRSAHQIAVGLGARPLLRELVALAGRAKIDLERSPQPERTPSLAEQIGLTRREQQVLSLVANGLTNREIAKTLFVTEKTAGAHVSNILGKLGVRSRVEAATAAHRLGLLPAEPAG